ncbi:hypothetical protein ACJ2A9_00660 [Anaerobacillus sp. MEB173]|uniref:hypothetical protein n=1 Tax=Anaerobacillus sp. MEB173 TaxID=3383345 RepID=UPI003F93353E
MKKIKKRSLLFLSTMALAVVVGCSADNEAHEEVDEQVSDIEAMEENEAAETDEDAESSQGGGHGEHSTEEMTEDVFAGMGRSEQASVDDYDLTSNIENEPGVLQAQVLLQDGAFGVLIIEEGVEQEEIDSLSERFAHEVKEKYPDMVVTVQATQGLDFKGEFKLE